MRKILSMCIIVLLICAISSTPVMARGIENVQNSGDHTDYSKLSTDKKLAIVEKAFNDYLSGKIDRLIIPGAKPGNVKPFQVRNNPFNYINKPDFENYSSKEGIITVNTALPNETNYKWWPATETWPGSVLYLGAGGRSLENVPFDQYASSVDGVIYPESLQNIQDQERFVMHHWGTGTSGENDIMFWKYEGQPNLVHVTWFMGGYNNRYGHGLDDCYVRTYNLSKDHVYSIYVKTVNPSSLNYNKVEFCIFDVTDFVWYLEQIPLATTASIDRADIALEQFYRGISPPGLTLKWRNVENFHIYNQTNARVNLAQWGFVYEYIYPGVSNAYYHDYSYYFEPNAQAKYYLTRYTGTYPPHP